MESDSLDDFFENNQILRSQLTGGHVSINGFHYNNPKKITDFLKENVSQEVLEARYQRFKKEFEWKSGSQELREKYSIIFLEGAISEVDKYVCHVSLNHSDIDLERVNEP